MRLENQRESSNIEDVRGGRGMRARGAGLGCGGLLLIGVIALLTGRNPLQLLQTVEEAQVGQPAPAEAGPAADDPATQFVSKVLANTEDVWTDLLARSRTPYEPPKLVLFSEAVQSTCGMASSAVGPFYCPGDQKVYLDTTFFDELEQRFGAQGDFAAAYVVAHEVGHHVQNLLGISAQVTEAQRRAWNEAQANELSVRLELQADCLAGVWANHADRDHQLIERGDFEEGLRAAAAIGDDQIQRRTQGYVVPESFTHGSAEQRVTWLRRGLESGDPNDCETFGR